MIVLHRMMMQDKLQFKTKLHLITYIYIICEYAFKNINLINLYIILLLFHFIIIIYNIVIINIIIGLIGFLFLFF